MLKEFGRNNIELLRNSRNRIIGRKNARMVLRREMIHNSHYPSGIYVEAYYRQISANGNRECHEQRPYELQRTDRQSR